MRARLGAMDGELAATLTQWNTFYSVSAGIAATLIGLLFVALALNPRIMADDSPAGLRVWSGQTFHSFLMVLTLSMIAIIPHDGATSVAIALAIIGGTGLVGVGQAFRSVRRDPDPAWRPRRAFPQFFSPALAYGICLWAAFLAANDNVDALSWMVSVVFFLMMSAAASCWDLLKALGNPKLPAADQP